MKYADLQKLDHKISEKLDRNQCDEYAVLLGFVVQEIQDLPLEIEDKIYLIQKIRDIYLRFEVYDKGDTYYEKIITNAKIIGKELLENLRNREKNNQEKIMIEKIPISDEDREILAQYGIKKLSNDKMMYRGGKARIIAKYKLGLPITSHDLTDDTDMYLDSSIDRLAIAKEFDCDTKGLKHISSCTEDTVIPELKEVDCTLNQVLAGEDHLILSDQCRKSLETGIITSTKKVRDFYGKYIFHTLLGDIQSGKVLRRLIKPLTDGRAKTLEIEKHNIEKNNLPFINFGQNILAHIRNYIKKSDEKQIGMYYRLAHILMQLDIISTHQEIFHYLSDLIENKYPSYTFAFHGSPIRQEADWVIKKLMHLVTDTIAMEKKIEKNPLRQGYQFTSQETIQIHATFDTPDEGFIAQYHTFKDQRKHKFTHQ